jgi:Pyruvate/2-oxoacid:ferredoxin oxidoreductase delta subunit
MDMTLKIDAHSELADKMGAPGSRRFIAILEECFTAEEARILLELFAPATCQEVASRLNSDEKSLSAKLDDLESRGVLTKGKTQYAFHTSVMAFHHDVFGPSGVKPVSDKLKELWGDFFRNEWCDMIVNSYIERRKTTGRNVFIVWPAVGALELSPNIRPEQILPEEDFRVHIKNAKRIINGLCGCRMLWGICDAPQIHTCFGLDGAKGEYYIDKPWDNYLKELSKEEALDIVHQAEQAGLVHIGICFCCTCCCEILYSLKRANRFDLLDPSRYLAVADNELCIGCQECVERCPFDAIEMKKVPGSKKLKASINSDDCKGCGVCIVGCKQKALRYELVRPPEHVVVPEEHPSGLSISESPRSRPGRWGFYDLD